MAGNRRVRDGHEVPLAEREKFSSRGVGRGETGGDFDTLIPSDTAAEYKKSTTFTRTPLDRLHAALDVAEAGLARALEDADGDAANPRVQRALELVAKLAASAAPYVHPTGQVMVQKQVEEARAAEEAMSLEVKLDRVEEILALGRQRLQGRLSEQTTTTVTTTREMVIEHQPPQVEQPPVEEVSPAPLRRRTGRTAAEVLAELEAGEAAERGEPAPRSRVSKPKGRSCRWCGAPWLEGEISPECRHEQTLAQKRGEDRNPAAQPRVNRRRPRSAMH